MADEKYSLCFAFPDESPSFVHGYEAGRIGMCMQQGLTPLEDGTGPGAVQRVRPQTGDPQDEEAEAAVIDRIEITIPELAPGLNGSNGLIRMHYRNYGRILDSWVWQVKAEAKRQRMSRASVTIDRFYARNPMDVDNLYATAKIPLDALRKAHVIPDDDPDSVTNLRVRQFKVDTVKEERTEIVLVGAGGTGAVPIDAIAEAVSDATGVSLSDLKGGRRTNEIADARHIAFYLAAREGHSLASIGRYFGGRDHSTVIHGRDKVEAMIENDDALARKVWMSEGVMARRKAA